MKDRLLLAALLLPLASSALADPRAEVEAAFRQVLAGKSYRALITSQDGKRQTQVEMAVQLPNRFRMKTEGTEVVILPEGTWMNVGGQWMPSPVNMSQMIAGYTAEAMEKGIDAIGEVSYLGEESVEGCESKNYRYRQSGEFMGMKGRSDSVLSICQENGKPVRIVTGEEGKPERATIVYDWDSPVSIQRPR